MSVGAIALSVRWRTVLGGASGYNSVMNAYITQHTTPYAAVAQHNQAPEAAATPPGQASGLRQFAQKLLTCCLLAGLGACNKGVTEPPAPTAIQPVSPVAAVPSAATVFATPPSAPNANAAVGRANSNLTRAEEANAMPLPGQNNDHSAPVIPASAPK